MSDTDAGMTEAERISRQQMAASALVGLIGECLVRNGRWDIDARGAVWMSSPDPADVERLAEFIGAEVAR